MTFLEKYELLKKSIPVPSVINGLSTIDCEFVDGVERSKNCVYSYDSGYCMDCIYTFGGWVSRTTTDCYFTADSEKCYECIDCNKCHGCTYLINCNSCTDCHFSAFLNSCTDCFGCVTLTHKKYCIFNKQYTKEEYLKRVKELRKRTPEKIYAQMLDLKMKIPHPASQQFNNENCPYGDYIYSSKNSYWSFNAWSSENSGYVYMCAMIKNSWDMFFSGGNPDKKTFNERCYELVNSQICYECVFLVDSDNCVNCYYSANLLNCSDCFGCVGLKNKKYCVLNNQLTKEQYEKIVNGIKNELGWRVDI